jgi:DNA-binding PadR family transcriptional regulator
MPLSPKEFIILSLLDQHGEMYGLEMVRKSDGKLARGTVYVYLQRMDDKGYVTSRQSQDHVAGTPKRLFSATATGRRALVKHGSVQRDLSRPLYST